MVSQRLFAAGFAGADYDVGARVDACAAAMCNLVAPIVGHRDTAAFAFEYPADSHTASSIHHAIVAVAGGVRGDVRGIPNVDGRR